MNIFKRQRLIQKIIDKNKLIYFIFFISLIIDSSASAYIGPGIAGGVIAATIGIVIAFFAMLFGIIWFPMKRLIKRKKKKPSK